MIKTFLSISQPVLLLFALLTGAFLPAGVAQNPIPNPDFEEWSAGEPVGWNTINQNILGTDFLCVTRDQTNPQSGTSCVKIETVTENIFLVGPVTMPGIISLGEITLDIINQTGTVEGGVPINTQPNMLQGYLRYQPSTGDSCIMGIGLFRWNGSSRDTLAYSYTTIGGLISGWQEFTVPIEYVIWAVPDTMNIMFFSSNLLTGSPVSGSTLWVDNLSLEYGPVSVKNPPLAAMQEITLVNSGNILSLSNLPAEGGTIQFISLNGAIVLEEQLKPGQIQSEISIARLSHGIYILKVTSTTGQQKTIKFSKN